MGRPKGSKNIIKNNPLRKSPKLSDIMQTATSRAAGPVVAKELPTLEPIQVPELVPSDVIADQNVQAGKLIIQIGDKQYEIASLLMYRQ